MKRFFIDKIENMRDIGGYNVSKNKKIKENLLVRSNVPINLGNEEINILKQMNLRTIIDLRSDDEIKNKPSVFMKNQGFYFNHIQINGKGNLPKEKNAVLDSYIEMLEGKEQIKSFFTILNEAKTGIIYYCNAGKDRTGVVTALILSLLGVDREEIVQDYMASGVFLKDMLQSYSKGQKDLFDIINPRSETMHGLLDYIDKKYSNVESYLQNCGLSMEILNSIKNKYTINCE